MEPQGGIGFFGVYISSDEKDSNKNTVYLVPGSLGLPDRDYYVSQDADSKEKRAEYVLHVTRMLQYLGETLVQAKTHAEKILAFETAMSQPRLNRVERRDSRKTYNPMTVAQLQKLIPIIKWDAYFKGIGIQKLNKIIVSEPKYMIALQTLLTKNKIED